MKFFMSVLLLLFVALTGYSQRYRKWNRLMSHVFNGLRLKKTSEEIVDIIKSNPRFIETAKNDSYDTRFIVNDPDNPKGAVIDSSVLKMKVLSYYVPSTQYSTNLSYFRLERYCNDLKSAELLFQYYWAKVKSLSSVTSEIRIGYVDEPGCLYGKSVNARNKYRFPSVSVTRNFDNRAKPVVVIEYGREKQ